MKVSCKIIEDLLPLYEDGVCSQQSKQLVEDHLKSCETCRKLLENTQIEPIAYVEPEKSAAESAFKKGIQKIRIRWLLSVVLVASLAASFVGGVFHYWQTQCFSPKEYSTGIYFMEQLQKGNYQEAFSCLDIEGKKKDWLELWFTEEELADFDERALGVFSHYAKMLNAAGGIETFELVEMTRSGVDWEGNPVYLMDFKIEFQGAPHKFYVNVSTDGVESIKTGTGYYRGGPLNQLSLWSEHLWQAYKGVCFDPDAGDYITIE